MSRRYDCSDPMERTRGIAEAVSAVRRGELIVLPTDTVYGIGADAFTPSAVTGLLNAKGRGRDMPPPVLVGSVRAAAALIDDLGTYGQDLIDEFWPGALTIVCRANPNLMWDLGETKGTVAVRMPMDTLAVELLKETGPLAVSSANLSGQPAARDADEAEAMLGDSVEVYLDGGPVAQGEASTIVDITGPIPRLLRLGAISEDKIRAVVGVLLTDEDDVKPDDTEIAVAADPAAQQDAAPAKTGAEDASVNGVAATSAEKAEAVSEAQRPEAPAGDPKPAPREDGPSTAS
ncbi:L-threonylcarbamoyladenylate synthase [Actinomadura gamaensis]|uniref:L-threonylcarbamoyladenylate synthase n=1 Tax=Actinomadura gamaensis TaxID=1763541 RepID=A0ABV9UDT2_9ACTN